MESIIDYMGNVDNIKLVLAIFTAILVILKLIPALKRASRAGVWVGRKLYFSVFEQYDTPPLEEILMPGVVEAPAEVLSHHLEDRRLFGRSLRWWKKPPLQGKALLESVIFNRENPDKWTPHI